MKRLVSLEYFYNILVRVKWKIMFRGTGSAKYFGINKVVESNKYYLGKQAGIFVQAVMPRQESAGRPSAGRRHIRGQSS